MLVTERLRMYCPMPVDAARVLDYFERNRGFHEPWSPPRGEGFYSLGYWSAQLDAALSDWEDRHGLSLFILRRDDPGGRILGQIAYSQVIRGPLQGCFLGYSLAAEAEGQGLMREALLATNRYVFEEFGLHRISASYRPENFRSGRLLRGLGFEVEGYAKKYLFIDGAWRDHIVTALISERGGVEVDG